jgi:uncharacterized protein involved in cysteine biosynthesis
MITTLGLIVAVIIVALVLYFVPGIDGMLKKILIGIVVVLAIFWLLGMFGIDLQSARLWR